MTKLGWIRSAVAQWEKWLHVDSQCTMAYNLQFLTDLPILYYFTGRAATKLFEDAVAEAPAEEAPAPAPAAPKYKASIFIHCAKTSKSSIGSDLIGLMGKTFPSKSSMM